MTLYFYSQSLLSQKQYISKKKKNGLKVVMVDSQLPMVRVHGGLTVAVFKNIAASAARMKLMSVLSLNLCLSFYTQTVLYC